MPSSSIPSSTTDGPEIEIQPSQPSEGQKPGTTQEPSTPAGEEQPSSENNVSDLSTTQSVSSTILPPSTGTSVSVPKGDFKVVCYFTNWAWYR